MQGADLCEIGRSTAVEPLTRCPDSCKALDFCPQSDHAASAMAATWNWQEWQRHWHAHAHASGLLGKELLPHPEGGLWAWERPGDGPTIYVSAGIHGDEPAGPLAMLELLRGGFFQSHPCHWLLCPALNPVGLARCRRENPEGIDLNRDYLLRASREVTAHADWLTAQPTPDLFLSLHEDWETSGFYFYEINLGGDQPDRARAILEAVAPWFHPEPGPDIDGHQPRAPGWIDHRAEADIPSGWPEAIFLAKQGCPLSFTFETPSQAPLAHRIRALAAALNSALAQFLATFDRVGIATSSGHPLRHE